LKKSRQIKSSANAIKGKKENMSPRNEDNVQFHVDTGNSQCSQKKRKIKRAIG
jgi:hypothetical protein